MSTGSVSSHSHSEFDYSVEEEEAEQPRQTRSRSAASVSAGTRRARPVAVSTSSVASASSTGSQREKLPANVEKQLLADIQLAGGIKDFDYTENQGLAKLLDNPERVNLYGNRGDPIRRRISHRVQHLKRRTVPQWNRILDRVFNGDPPKIGVPHQASQQAPPPPPPPPRSISATSKSVSRPPPTPPSRSKRDPRNVPREINTSSTPPIVSPLGKSVAKMAPTKYRTYLYLVCLAPS